MSTQLDGREIVVGVEISPSRACAHLKCHAQCMELHAKAMSAIMVDLVNRAAKKPDLTAQKLREVTWNVWERYRQQNCFARKIQESLCREDKKAGRAASRP